MSRSNRWWWIAIPVALSVWIISKYYPYDGLQYLVQKGVITSQQMTEQVGYMWFTGFVYLLLIWSVSGIIALIAYFVRRSHTTKI